MRTIFLYGFGAGLQGPQPWWASPWIERPWLDNGRLQFSRDHAPSVENLYHEGAAIAQIDVIAPVLRMVAADGGAYSSLPLLRQVVEAHTFDFQAAGHPPPTWCPFFDTGILPDLATHYTSDPVFDLASAFHAALVWSHTFAPFLQMFDETQPTSLQNPVVLERTPDGRLLVILWSLNVPGVINQRAAPAFLRRLEQYFQGAGYQPAWIVDQSWLQHCPHLQVYGVHNWFVPEADEAWSVRRHRGIITGVAVPGFHDPPWGTSQPPRILGRRDGDTLREALQVFRRELCDYAILESLTNIEESAGFYRTDQWGDLYLQIVREHQEATR